tara:strand:- start:104 stop:1198 length:1095 start_codon:yes stop_codon:yes gene_type:complete
MDFVSADRSGEAEFNSQLQNYNLGVANTNLQIQSDIESIKEKAKTDKGDIDSGETGIQIKDAIAGGSAVAGATATLKRAMDYEPKVKTATLKRAGGVAEEVGEGVEGAGEVGEGAEGAEGAIAVARAGGPLDVSVEVGQAGEGAEGAGEAGEGVAEVAEGAEGAGEVAEAGEAGGGLAEVASSALRTGGAGGGVAEVASSALRTAGAGAEGAGAGAGLLKGAGSALLKGGAGSLLKGVGAIGSIGTLGMDIASDTGGGWKAKSTADKWGNVMGIAGSAMDLVGLGLEMTPLAPIGLGLQVVGTGLQLGSGLESEISSEDRVDPAKGAVDTQAGKDIAEINKPMAKISGVSLAQTGGLAVARQQQ